MRRPTDNSSKLATRLANAARRALLAALLLACGPASAQARSPQALVHKPAPAFVRRDLNGQQLSLARLRGKVVLLNFWATWCGPCLTEMPEFMAWQRQFAAQGFQVVGISMDDDAAAARKLATKLKVDYPIAMGDPDLGRHYGGVLGLPLTFLIDRKGEVRAVYQGVSNLNAIQTEIRTLLIER